LTSLERRLELLADAGADAALVLRFTPEFSQVSAEDFVTSYLLGSLRAAAVVVGENFRFGHRAAGDVELLRRICAEQGVRVVGLPLDGDEADGTGAAWSSSYVRQRLADGDVAAAARALGRPFTIQGSVVRGDARGHDLGYPTANVPVTVSETAVPADGVYAGWLRRRDEPDSPFLPAAISVGTNPTFDGSDRRVESYVLDRDDLELYDVLVEVAFVERLRGMVKFTSVDDLLVQMADDVARARALLTTPPVPVP
jgi:riboflavin kinase/FMN adenylyltransferase